MRILILFTEYFPYSNGSEIAFIQNEIKHLISVFDDVVVVPSMLIHKQTVFGDFKLDKSLASDLAIKKTAHFKNALRSRYFYKELVSKNILFWNSRKLKRLVFFTSRAKIVKEWAKEFISQYDKSEKVLFYTFWNNEITLGLSDLRKVKTVSRAHGFDLYEEFHGYYGYLPCYKYILQNIEKLYLVSQPAREYLSAKYPSDRFKFLKFHLGVKAAIHLSDYSTDETIRIVSCSNLSMGKRVELIINGILKFIEEHHLPIKWTHFGDGELRNELTELLNRNITENFSYELKGKVSNKAVLSFYETEQVDLFITTTESEGGVPVSLQEAQAHGIPIIGTSVGGVPEIVNNNVGRLLSANPDSMEIADAIHYIISDKERMIGMRKNSYLNWKAHFDEKTNYKLFSKELSGLLSAN